MKSGILYLVVLGALGFGFYKLNQSPCNEPLTYSIAKVDGNFGIDRENFRNRVADAELVWEKFYGKNLFQYDASSKFTINLIYDERQRTIDLKQKTEFGLTSAESNFKQKDAAFNSLKLSYESKASLHEQMVANFKEASREYEADVQSANKGGGVSQKEYADFERRREGLNRQIEAINSSASELKVMVEELNSVLQERNLAADSYNLLVRDYNNKYGSGLEFDQAEYVGNSINVYEFKNSEDLKIALAHELGHAIGMDHVENEKSIMYYITNSGKISPTAEDRAELYRVCASPLSKYF